MVYTSRPVMFAEGGVRSLLHYWPEPSSTNDLDIFLCPELLIDSAKWVDALKLSDQHGKQPCVVEAGHIVLEHFKRPRIGLLVTAFRAFFKLTLAAFLRASDMVFMPIKKSPELPINPKIISIPI